MTELWDEIHGFSSPSEYARFVRYLEGQVLSGAAKEIAPDPEYGAGEIYGGRWFQHSESGEIWRLVSPDPPFHGLWEPVCRPPVVPATRPPSPGG
jgi:hypothetical protein